MTLYVGLDVFLSRYRVMVEQRLANEVLYAAQLIDCSDVDDLVPSDRNAMLKFLANECAKKVALMQPAHIVLGEN